MVARRCRVLIILAVLGLLATACGTRLPDSAFEGGDDGGSGGDELSVGAQGGGDGTGSGGGGSGSEADGASGSGGRSGGSGGGSGGSGGGGSGGGGGAKGGGGGGAQAAGPGGPNTASDVGVTASEIKVGNITAKGGTLGPDAFTPPLHGVQAYFQQLNERGGVNGRKVVFRTCDDQEDPSRNKACVENLVKGEKVFALVANSTHTYQAARDVDAAGVPDVGGQPIGNAYYKYPHLFSILGAEGYPRDGKAVGIGGKLYAQTATYRFFKQKKGVSKAAVFFYVIPISKTAGEFIADGLEREGVDVAFTPNGGAGRNPADPSYDSDVLAMQRANVNGIWNAIDIAGFQKLCQAMDRYSFTVKANVSTIQGWSQRVGERFSPTCRKTIFANGESRPYSDAGHPAVADFLGAMKKFDPDYPLHQWALEGWAAGVLFTDGVKSMGPAPTRKGLVQWLDGQRDYTAGGLFKAVDWRRDRNFGAPAEDCFSLVQWSDSKDSFVPAAPTFTCDSTAFYSYQPEDDGS